MLPQTHARIPYCLFDSSCVSAQSLIITSSESEVFVCVIFSDIFMNYRGQPIEQAGFADCGYFESPSSTEFAAVASPVVTAPQLHIDTQLAQVLLL